MNKNLRVKSSEYIDETNRISFKFNGKTYHGFKGDTLASALLANDVHLVGAGTDDYVSYTQKGSHQIVEGTLNAILELYPIFSRMRMLRQWGGIVDICPDASPILSKTSIKGLYFNCGWGTGGFKATPGSGDLFAHTIANDEPHKLNAAFNLNRFVSGDLVDEHGAAAVAH